MAANNKKEYTITFNAQVTVIMKDIPKGKMPKPAEELERVYKDIIKMNCDADDVVISDMKIFEGKNK